jgi:hypothetical protein
MPRLKARLSSFCGVVCITHYQPAAMPFAARPRLNGLIDLLPTTQVEVAYTDINAIGYGERLVQRPGWSLSATAWGGLGVASKYSIN